MANNIINCIIDKYRNNILEINKDLTKSSLFTGEIQMANLKIKPEIFTLLNLPFFELVHGYVGKLRIKVQLPRVHLHPIKVEVENVFFHSKQKKLSNIKKESEIKFMEGFKNMRLQSLEEFKNQLNDSQDEQNPNMLSKLINNIEINVSNVCIRFDDDISYTAMPFCFGILIKNIKLKSVDKEFKEVESKYSLPFEEINNKIIKIDNFSIYLDTFENEGTLVEYNKKIIDTPNTQIQDAKFQTFLGPMLDYYRYCLSETYEHINNYDAHNYLLFNLCILFKVSINENLKNGKPKITAECKMDEVKMELSLVQIKALLKLSLYQNLMLKYQLGLSKEYYNKKLSEEEKMEYIDKYIIYYDYMYGKKPNEKKGNKMKTVLSKIEEGLLYEEIQIMRNAAESKMSHRNEAVEIEQKLKEIKNDKKFFKKLSFIKKNKNKEEEENKEKDKQKQIQELEQQKTDLQQKVTNIVKDKLEHIELLSGLLPDSSGDFNILKLNFEIQAINFSILRHKEEKLFTMNISKFGLFGDVKNRQQFITLSIKDMSMLQYQLPESKYQMIMTTVQQKNENFAEEEKNDNNESKACYIELENNPEFPNSNFRIKFRNQKRIILIVNIFSLQYMSKKFSDYMVFFMDKNFDFPEKFDVSGDIYKYIKDGFKCDSSETNVQHLNADLDVTIKSPIVLFPIDILDNSNQKCILIRCGDFHICSLLPPRQDPKINYAEIKERDKLVDKYIIKSEKLCVTTLDNFEGDMTTLLDSKGLNLIEDVSFVLNADIMFEPKNTFFERFKIEMNVGKCNVKLRDVQLPFFMEMFEKSGKLIKLAMYKLEDKTYFEKKEIKINKEEEETYNKNNKNKKDNKKDEKNEKIELINEKNNEKGEKIELINEINNSNINIIDNKENIEEQKDIIDTRVNKEIIEELHDIKDNKEIIEEKKDIKDTKDKNLLIFNFHLEKFQFCLQKTISYGERRILSEAKEEELKNLMYRDFIIFDMNNFKIQLILTEKLNANVILLIKSIGVIDKETLITNIKNPYGDLYINKDFQNIIKMVSEDNNNEMDRISSLHQYRLSSDTNTEESFLVSDVNSFVEENIINNNDSNKDRDRDKDNYDAYFMVLKFNHNNETQTQYADILLKKIKVCISMNTMGRIMQFGLY